MDVLAEIIIYMFVRSWLGSAIRHVGAVVRYVCLKIFCCRRNVTYKNIRYGSDESDVTDCAGNDIVNSCLGFIVIVVVVIFIVKLLT